MLILLPGALPDAAQIDALAPHIHRVAPTLHQWCRRGRTSVTAALAAQTGCTADEQWQLNQRGFIPEADQRLGAGVAALLAGAASTPQPPAHEPLWLVELVHLALARDGASLVPARKLALNAADSAALYASAQTLCQDSGFTLHPHSTTHWRVVPAEPLRIRCASPALVALTSVHDWWPQEPSARAWRQCFNALQMQWFDHPVNQARVAQNLLPVNGLWLFGGACPRQHRTTATAKTQVYHDLYDAWAQQDWGAWLVALETLERTVFAPRARPPALLVLTGRERYVESRPTPTWRRWFARCPTPFSTMP